MVTVVRVEKARRTAGARRFYPASRHDATSGVRLMVVRLAAEDLAGAEQLLEQHHPRQLVR